MAMIDAKTVPIVSSLKIVHKGSGAAQPKPTKAKAGCHQEDGMARNTL